MSEPAQLPLGEWESFYVIVGSSAAVLTGLMFVVIALSSERKPMTSPLQYHAFATPTVVHFCVVLLVSALLSMPRQTVTTLALSLGAIGLAGLGVMVWASAQVRRQHGYVMVASDWVWHVALPLVSYASLLATSVALWRSPAAALYAVGVDSLLLLFIGIHNAWDAALWIALENEE